MRITELDISERRINSKWTNPIGILMIVLGLFAIVFPFFATVVSTLMFGWIFMFAGIAQTTYAIKSPGRSHFFWQLMLGLLYFLGGLFVVVYPLKGVIALTWVLGVTIFAQGVIQVSLALQLRRISPNWVWMLVSGLVGIVFGIFVWSNFSLSATWLIGLLIGTNLLFDGLWMLMLQTGQRHT